MNKYLTNHKAERGAKEKLSRSRNFFRSGVTLVEHLHFAVLLSFIFFLSIGQSAVRAQASRSATAIEGGSTGNSDIGRGVFATQNCGTCHGADAQGGVGPRIGPPPGTFAEFLTSVREPGGQMPPYAAKAVSDQQLMDVYAFLKTLSPPAESVSSLTGHADTGKRLFMEYGCYECHGTVGQGGSNGVRIGPPPISMEALIAYVRQPNRQMPPYRKQVASDQDLVDIYSYLRSVPPAAPVQDIPLLK